MQDDQKQRQDYEQDDATNAPVMLGDEDIRDICDAVHAQDTDTVSAVLNELSPADTADLLGKINDHDREELITMYLNPVDFGSNAFGIHVATRTFFGVAPDQLSIPEAAVL